MTKHKCRSGHRLLCKKGRGRGLASSACNFLLQLGERVYHYIHPPKNLEPPPDDISRSVSYFPYNHVLDLLKMINDSPFTSFLPPFYPSSGVEKRWMKALLWVLDFLLVNRVMFRHLQRRGIKVSDIHFVILKRTSLYPCQPRFGHGYFQASTLRTERAQPLWPHQKFKANQRGTAAMAAVTAAVTVVKIKACILYGRKTRWLHCGEVLKGGWRAYKHHPLAIAWQKYWHKTVTTRENKKKRAQHDFSHWSLLYWLNIMSGQGSKLMLIS